LQVLLRVEGAIDTALPSDGKSGDEWWCILRDMEGWVSKWEWKCHDLLENELNRKRRDGKTSLSDIALWESFLDYLKKLEHDIVDEESTKAVDEPKGQAKMKDRLTKRYMKKLFGCDTWPPKRFPNSQSLVLIFRAMDYGNGKHVAWAIRYAVRDLGYAPRWLSDVLSGVDRTLRRGPYNYHGTRDFALAVAHVLIALSDDSCKIVKARGLLVVCWDLWVTLFSLHMDVVIPCTLQALRGMIRRWPMLETFLVETEKGVQVVDEFRDMMKSSARWKRLLGFNSLCRVSYSLGARLPVDGKTGARRNLILEKMDEWFEEWYYRWCDVIEKELDRMRRGEEECYGDVELWESYLAYLGELDNGSDELLV
jgi:hypothetical protein